MKKVILLILVSILLLFAFTSCAKITNLKNKIFRKACEHEWTDATCTSAKTCKLCGEQEGALGPHRTVDATCTTPQMCSVCGFTSEYWEAARGHEWAEASCFKGVAKTCRVCQLVEGEVPAHDWSEPTCIEDSKCSVCSLTDEGSALGHNYVDAAEVPATCTTNGTAAGVKCSRCSDVQSGCATIPALNHKGYEVEIPGTPATCTEPGLTPGLRCTKCETVTEQQLVLDPLGHQRYTYDDAGEKLTDGYLKTEYPINPATGLPFAACEADGTTTFTCQLCAASIEATEPKISHKYPAGAICTDTDAQCEYCGKNIEHEFLDPTCTEAAICTICNETDDTRPALNHTHTATGESAMLPATCLAPATCELCGMTEGKKLTHKLTVDTSAGRLNYSCTTCDTAFSPLDESYYLDGSTHDHIVPVNNKFGGYETHLDADGNPTQAPAIKTDANGNEYYSLIKVNEPETNEKGEAYPPQVQLWIPLQRGGFTGFTASNSATGFLSFRINAYMTENFSLTFVEGGGWAKEDVIRDFFVLAPPTTDEDTGRTSIQLLAMDDADAETATPVLFEKDITDATTVDDKFTGWLDVYIAIVLDDATDTINLHYYIDGMYRGSVTTPLTTSGNGIKCIYVSGNTKENGSGIMLDDIGFGYTVNGDYAFDVEHEHVYNIESTRVEPTCVNDGYVIYTCDCGAIGTRTSIPNLGHLTHTVEAVEPTCTTDGHNEYSYCTREDCGAYIVKQIVYPATGHDFDTSKNQAPTCTTGGLINQTCRTCNVRERYQVPALGHEYALSDNCLEAANCIVCGTRSVGSIGHSFGDPTCTTPSTCLRDGCGVTTGEPLGHNLADATCTAPQTCTRCDHTEGHKLAHTMEVKYVKSVLTYACTTCNASFHFDKGYVLNGANTDNMYGVGNKDNNYTTTTGTDLPKIVDGHYELLNTSGKQMQLQLWVPTSDNPNDFGFSSANNAVGVLSFKMNVNMEQALTIKLVDGISNPTTSNRWTSKAVAGFMTISAASGGKVTIKHGFADDSTAQTNAHVIAEIEVGQDNFTGWCDIVIGIVLDPVTDQITYHCYTNGQYITSFSAELTTKTNSINAVYISGNTTSQGSGLMFDDFAFGYTANGTWVFDECNHEGTPEVIAPTCTEDGYTKTLCTKCGHITITDVVTATGHTEKVAPTCDKGSLCATCGQYYGEALGHTGGTATCTAKPICDRCGKAYGSPSHDMVEATCGAAAYCKACNAVFGEKVSHKPVATLENEKVTYSCEFCKVSYVLDQAYYQDGDTSLGNVVTVMEDGGYVYDPSDSSFKFTLESAAKSNGKAWVWMPTNGTGITDFEGFKVNTVGVLSFSLDVYTADLYEVQLIDSDYRNGGPSGSFWNAYSMKILTVSAPDNNVVSVKSVDGSVLKTFNVSDSNKYTGMFDVTIGIELIGSNIVLHYYIDGQYVTSITTQMKIASGKIDGVAFMCQSKVIGSGYTLDNIAFGYAKPYDGNPAPVKPKD